MFFLLFAAFSLYFCIQADAHRSHETLWAGITGLGVLLLSVLIHELAHYYALARLGGTADRVVLGPLGGMAPLRFSSEPREELAVACAGPVANLVLAVISLIVLAAALPVASQVWSVLHPLQPNLLDTDSNAWQRAVKLCLWINWMLLLVNLIPAYPFDASRALRAGVRVLRPQMTSAQAHFLVFLVARVLAVVLLIAAWFLWRRQDPQIFQPWFAMVLLGILIFFSAGREDVHDEELEHDERPFGYDFSQGYTSLERSTTDNSPRRGPLQRWLLARRAVREQRRLQRERDEERRVDEILVRLHEHGMESLSAEDRLLLQRVSARYRDTKQQ